MYKLTAEGLSDIGLKRMHNEDSFLVRTDLALLAIADGMGGHVGGAIASQIAVRTVETFISQTLVQQAPQNLQQATQVASLAIQEASKAIYTHGRLHPHLQGMGTTLTLVLFIHEHAIIAHVGDSRAYLLHNQTLEQISEDHSLVQEQFKAGLITAEQARLSPFKNVITRSVGFEPSVYVDLHTFPIQMGDRLLLCTDGLNNMVPDDTIRQILMQHAPLHTITGLLISEANQRGGDDNITVVLAQLEPQSS